MKFTLKISCYFFLLFLVACKTDQKSETPVKPKKSVKKSIPVPKFNGDNAYAHIEKQLSFGPRVPNSEGHAKCKAYIKSTLESNGIKIATQDFDAEGYTGTVYKGTNIIGRINPDNNNRIILAAHWDTRFMADQDDDNNGPSLQADDGGSGVGVLLEMAKLLTENSIDLGVDLIFFDVEDQGKSDGDESTIPTWGMGAQYWAKNPHIKGYQAKYGILLDMVGAKDAQFPKERVTGVFKPNIVRSVHQPVSYTHLTLPTTPYV